MQAFDRRGKAHLGTSGHPPKFLNSSAEELPDSEQEMDISLSKSLTR